MRKSLDLTKDVVSTKVSLNEQVTHKMVELTSSANTIRKYNASSYYHLSSSTTDDAGNGYTGWYQTVYSGSYLVSSSYPLFDLTFGYSSASVYYTASANWRSEKNRIYKLFAQQLMGNIDAAIEVGGTSFYDLYFICLRRSIYHDKIRPGYDLIVTCPTAPITYNSAVHLSASDLNASSSMYTKYGGNAYVLTTSAGTTVGCVFYDAGVIAISSSMFAEAVFSSSTTQRNTIVSGTLDNIMSGGLAHLSGVIYQNTTQLHSTIYMCSIDAGEFNYSANPTYVDTDGRILITKANNSGVVRDSETYITGVNLYDDQNNLLACSKISFPIKKEATQALILRARMDY